MGIGQKFIDKITNIFSRSADKAIDDNEKHVSILPKLMANNLREFRDRLLDAPEYSTGIKSLDKLIGAIGKENQNTEDLLTIANGKQLVSDLAQGKREYQIYIDDAASMSDIANEKLTKTFDGHNGCAKPETLDVW